MSVLETVLVFAGIPLVIYGLVMLLTLRQNFARRARYRPGQGWDYPPVWWTANPEGAGFDTGADSGAPSRSAKTAAGGARGSW